MFTPFLNPGEFESTSPPNSQAPSMPGGSMMEAMTQPHLSFAAWIAGALALKFFTESDILSLDVTEVKISLYNILAITLQAGFGFVGLKVLVGYALQKGIPLFGFGDFVGAF